MALSDSLELPKLKKGKQLGKVNLRYLSTKLPHKDTKLQKADRGHMHSRDLQLQVQP
jgi:hypothetical protein